MYKYKADFTNTFIALTFDNFAEMEMFKTDSFNEWHKRWQARLDKQKESKASSHILMRNSNPAVIPRNHRVEEALEAVERYGDLSVMEKLLEVLSNPFAHSEKQAEYAKLPAKASCGYRTFCGT